MSSVGFVSALNSSNVIFPSDSKLHNIPSSEWLTKWWQWWAGIPNDKHPFHNPSDTKSCSLLQDGPVWFLPQSVPADYKNYHCDIPAGKDILLPISITECEIGGVEGELDDNGLKACTDNIATPPENIVITVDGMRVDSQKLGPTVKGNFFNVTYPQNAIDMWGNITPGTYRALAEGFFIFLHDLQVGQHHIKFHVQDVLKRPQGGAEPPSVADYTILVR